jgi:hypothetical protein
MSASFMENSTLLTFKRQLAAAPNEHQVNKKFAFKLQLRKLKK